MSGSSPSSHNKMDNHISFLLFKLPITISLLLFLLCKNNYTSSHTYFTTIKADSVITKEIAREPKLLGRWFSYSDDASVCKQIRIQRPKGHKIFHLAIYEYAKRKQEVAFFYLKDQTIRANGQKYELVSLCKN